MFTYETEDFKVEYPNVNSLEKALDSITDMLYLHGIFKPSERLKDFYILGDVTISLNLEDQHPTIREVLEITISSIKEEKWEVTFHKFCYHGHVPWREEFRSEKEANDFREKLLNAYELTAYVECEAKEHLLKSIKVNKV